MQINKSTKISETEKKLLSHIFSCAFELDINFNKWEEFYNVVEPKLLKTCEINEDVDLEGIFQKIGIQDINADDEIYVIDRMPDDVYKITWQTLKDDWDEIWEPPMDDAIILYIPNRTIVLVTHWDMVYYN